jgi:hypothetical protein
VAYAEWNNFAVAAMADEVELNVYRMAWAEGEEMNDTVVPCFLPVH